MSLTAAACATKIARIIVANAAGPIVRDWNRRRFYPFILDDWKQRRKQA
jgi:hypothetical protein